MNKKLFWWFLVLGILSLLCSCVKVSVETVSNAGGNVPGVLDFSNFKFNDRNTVSLKGQWYFWEDKLLSDYEVREQIDKKDPNQKFVEVPSLWSDATFLGKDKEVIHSGTIAIKLILPKGFESWHLRVPNVDSACTLFANGKKISEIGKTARIPRDAIGSNGLDFPSFTCIDGNVLLIMHISNFDLPYTGLWDVITLGLNSAVVQKHTNAVISVCLTSGALIFMGLHHLIFFFLRHKEKDSILFALICFFMAVRNLMVGERILMPLFPMTIEAYKFAFNIEHLSAHMVLPLFYLFFRNIFKNEMKKIPVIVVCAVGALWAVMEIFTPLSFHHKFLSLYEYFIVISGAYAIFVLIMACIHKRSGSVIIIIGTAILLGTAVNDVLFSNRIIQSEYVASYGFFLFCFSQSLFLSRRFTKSLSQVEQYSAHLQLMNKALDRFVPHEMIKLLGTNDISKLRLGDHTQKTMTVLFLDIRNFTSMSEKMTPRNLFNLLNTFLAKFGPIIREHNGFIDKYLGDGFMALFPNRPEDAIDAALEMRESLQPFNTTLPRNLELHFGIGIHSGSLMLGTIGESMRMDSTVISDTVNTASRVESLNKIHGTDILISGACMDSLTSIRGYEIVKVADEFVKGKSIPISVYTVSKSKSLLGKAMIVNNLIIKKA